MSRHISHTPARVVSGVPVWGEDGRTGREHQFASPALVVRVGLLSDVEWHECQCKMSLWSSIIATDLTSSQLKTRPQTPSLPLPYCVHRRERASKTKNKTHSHTHGQSCQHCHGVLHSHTRTIGRWHLTTEDVRSPHRSSSYHVLTSRSSDASIASAAVPSMCAAGSRPPGCGASHIVSRACARAPPCHSRARPSSPHA